MLESEGCGVCNTILSNDAFLVSGKSIEGFVIMYNFMVPNFEAFKKIFTSLEGMGIKVNVRKIVKFEAKAGILTE